MSYQPLLNLFVERSKSILGNVLTGIYLHGSTAMGCFNEKKSDIDLIIVVNCPLSDEIKLRYMEMVVELNAQAPAKGLELSIVRENVCKPFIYPTPYELHFSTAHLNLYLSDPHGYVERMQGTDKDLAAHFTILWHRGILLCGKAIREVFTEVGKEEYFDSIWYDIEHATEEIGENPMYIILNLCRVLAYKKDALILSKEEGGNWGLSRVPARYRPLLSGALTEYQMAEAMTCDKTLAKNFAEYMLEQLKASDAEAGAAPVSD